MSMKSNSRELGLTVLQALGIEPKDVRGFELRCYAGEIPTLRIERFVDAEYDTTSIEQAFISTRPGKVIKSELIELEPREQGKVGQ